MDPSTEPLDKLKAAIEAKQLNKSIKELVTPLFKALISAVREAKQSLDKRVDSALDTLMKRVDARLAEIRQPADGKDGAKGEKGDKGDVGDTGPKGADGKDGQDGSPDSAFDVRNKLELLDGDERLEIKAIKDLREELDELKKIRAKGGGGGGSSMAVAHWPIHETFTMNGSDTTVTLQQAPAANGTAIFGMRYQGQTLDLTTHYTVNGNKITFVGFTPDNGGIISITYLP